MKVKSESEVSQSCPTLSDPMDCSLPGSSAHRIFQARVLEWVAIAFLHGLHYMDSNPLFANSQLCFLEQTVQYLWCFCSIHNVNMNGAYLIVLLCGLNESIHVKLLEQQLVVKASQGLMLLLYTPTQTQTN